MCAMYDRPFLPFQSLFSYYICGCCICGVVCPCLGTPCATLSKGIEAVERGDWKVGFFCWSMGIEGAKKLAVALEKNSTTKEIYIGYQDVQDEGFWAICEALKKNTHLQTINCCYNGLTGMGLDAFEAMLLVNKTIKTAVFFDEAQAGQDCVCYFTQLPAQQLERINQGLYERRKILKRKDWAVAIQTDDPFVRQYEFQDLVDPRALWTATQLRAFYDKLDPTRTEEQIKTVAIWSVENGIDAVNAKLREKYQCDLSVLNEPKI